MAEDPAEILTLPARRAALAEQLLGGRIALGRARVALAKAEVDALAPAEAYCYAQVRVLALALELVQREVGFAQSALANARGRSFTATRAIPREEDALADAIADASGGGPSRGREASGRG